MPKGLVKTKRDEALWKKAKAQARKRLPESAGEHFWKLVNHIYQNMKHAD